MKHLIVTELYGIEHGFGKQNFRTSLGYQDENDFPNVFESWLNTIAQDEVESLTSAFQEHLTK